MIDNQASEKKNNQTFKSKIYCGFQKHVNCSQSTGAFLVAINDLSLADLLKEIEFQKVKSMGYGWFQFFLPLLKVC